MRIAVLGTGMVGAAIATKLVEVGHDVAMGSRQAGNEKARAWAESAGPRASTGTFADVARSGEIVINATNGAHALDALHEAGAENLAGKVLIDISNPLDASAGFPPSLFVSNTDSLGEQIQRAFPDARVVKTLNTITAGVMVNPGSIPGRHAVFLSGNDAEAKAEVKELLTSFGWTGEGIWDLGDISTARGTEMYVALWLRLLGTIQSPHFNIEIKTG